jgi:hypothetical protein
MPKLYFNNTRYADLPLHYGQVPPWLVERMTNLGGANIVEKERADSWKYGGRTVFGKSKPPKGPEQLKPFQRCQRSVLSALKITSIGP